MGDIAGVSDVFPGGFVTYSLQTKAGFLEIDPELLAEYGTVSKECVEQMAIQANEAAWKYIRYTSNIAQCGLEGTGCQAFRRCYSLLVCFQQFHYDFC